MAAEEGATGEVGNQMAIVAVVVVVSRSGRRGRNGAAEREAVGGAKGEEPVAGEGRAQQSRSLHCCGVFVASKLLRGFQTPVGLGLGGCVLSTRLVAIYIFNIVFNFNFFFIFFGFEIN